MMHRDGMLATAGAQQLYCMLAQLSQLLFSSTAERHATILHPLLWPGLLSCRCERSQLFGWVEGGKGLHGAQAQFIRYAHQQTPQHPQPVKLSRDAHNQYGLVMLSQAVADVQALNACGLRLGVRVCASCRVPMADATLARMLLADCSYAAFQ